jgi:hypothetical protein
MDSGIEPDRDSRARVVFGWDVGGANVKAARLSVPASAGAMAVTAERAFPLWREPAGLAAVLVEMAAQLGGSGVVMGVTMTAELADCFPAKRDGVRAVLDSFGTAFPDAEIRVFDVDGLFRTVPEALEFPLAVAAANWVATATLVARRFPNAILVDCGGTTTDIIPLVDGRVAARGRTDPERLALGELVYTGMQRTPVCAVLDVVPIDGNPCRVAAEVFAIAADAHRWLGRLSESDYTSETPDGRGRSREDAGRRLARMVCGDREMLGDDEITAIATAVVRGQAEAIAAGIRQVREALGPAAPDVAIAVGSGATLARMAARNSGFSVPSVTGTGLPEGPAAAIALLLGEMWDRL